MPLWLTPLLNNAGNFIGQRFLHFIVYALLALITIGIPYKLFVKDTNKIAPHDGGIVNMCEKETPLVGCSISKIRLKVIWQ